MLGSKTIPAELFHYEADIKTFIAEASELRGYNFLTVFPTSQTKGFMLTGNSREIMFKLESIDSNDGDIQGWRFISESDSMVTGPESAILHALIIND